MSKSTHLDELIAAERAKANARISKLRKQAEAEQRKIDAKVVELLKEQHRESYEKLVERASAALVAEKAERSRKAKSAVLRPAAQPVSEVADTTEQCEGVRQSWNG